MEESDKKYVVLYKIGDQEPKRVFRGFLTQDILNSLGVEKERYYVIGSFTELEVEKFKLQMTGRSLDKEVKSVSPASGKI